MRRIIIALALGLASLSAAADHKPGHEVLILSFEECVSMGTAVVQYLNSQQQNPAISPNAQKAVDDAMPRVMESLKQATPEERLNYIANIEEAVAQNCFMAALATGGQIPMEVGADR